LTELEIALVLLSALLHAGWSVTIKSSPDPLAFNLVQAWFAPLVGLALLPWIEIGEIPLQLLGWSAVSGVAHAIYFYWLTRAFEQGDMSLVYPIARSAPAFVPLVAVPLLGESLTLGGASGIGVVVLGMWAVYGRGALDRRNLWEPGTRYALLTLAASVAYSLLDKQGMAQMSELPWSSPLPRAVVFYLLLHATLVVVFTPLVLRKRSASALASAVRAELVRGSAASAVSFLGYGLILAALATAPVSYVVAVRQTSVLFAVVLSVAWLGERPGPARILGSVATVLGVGLIARFS
jgi:uncharacterized membrane protein